MKYNPKVNELLASLEGFANLHPLQSDEDSQGALEPELLIISPLYSTFSCNGKLS